MDAALHALMGPRRREILELIRFRELSSGEIAAHFNISHPAVSQHLGVLREAGLVRQRRDGNRRLYRARAEGMAPLRAFIEGFWIEHLSRLKEAVERDKEQP